MKKRETPTIGAGSMADIAFLLLIFFLVSTTIQTDKGLSLVLPPWSKEPSRELGTNVLSILINSNDELMVEKEKTNIGDLKSRTERFILLELASPQKGIVSITNKNGTSYGSYIAVLNEVKAGYHQVWEDVALKKYGNHYDDLKETAQHSIRVSFPLVISEANPEEFAFNEH